MMKLRIAGAFILIYFLLHTAIFAAPLENYSQAADTTMDSFISKFWNISGRDFHSQFPNNGKAAPYWNSAQAMDAILDGVEKSDGKKYKLYMERFFLGQGTRGWLVDHFDDENWMALVMLRCFDSTKETRYLENAKYLFDDISNNAASPIPDGLWWDKSHAQKATASNAGPVITAARLYQRTKERRYLDIAQNTYQYWMDTMVNPTTFQVTDHILPSGEKIYWKFTYNEGLMLGASLELYKQTKDPLYLENAHRFANFMMTHETATTSYGPSLFDGDNQSCTGDCHQFKGIGFRYLALLYQQDPKHTEYYSFLKSNVDSIWNLARDTSNNTFSPDWAGPPLKETSIASNSSAVMALNIFAQLKKPLR